MIRTTVSLGFLATFAIGCLAAGADARAAAPAARKSVKQWVHCDGRAIDNDGFVKALAAASHHAFTLLVDCPMRLHFGMEFEKTIYIDDGTAVQFTGQGKVTVDNVMVPAFVIANASDVDLLDWNVEYVAGLPIDGDVHGFTMHGKFTPSKGRVQPAGAFNNFSITPYLANNRHVKFDKSQGNVTAIWNGGILPMAVLMLTGDSARVNVTGMRMYVPKTAGIEGFIPLAFALCENFKSNQTVTKQTPITAQYVAVPHEVVFSNIELDGTLMGWLGNLRDATFDNIRSHRYGDLEAADGSLSGGVGKWFAPPHLFYLNYTFDGDPELFNKHIKITNVVDDGPRVGSARDKGGGDSLSGYANSLKLGCVDCSVDHYKTNRLDGFMDVLTSDGLTVSNVDATYDSGFLNGVFPGWRFPSPSYKNLTFRNIVLTDVADTARQGPMSNLTSASNENISLSNVTLRLKQWPGQKPPTPTINGQGIDVTLHYVYNGDTQVTYAQKNTVAAVLESTPTGIAWSSRQATECAAEGAWSGPIATNGNKTASVASGSQFTLKCAGGGDSAIAAVDRQ
jgi:hypothetical protein